MKRSSPRWTRIAGAGLLAASMSAVLVAAQQQPKQQPPAQQQPPPQPTFKANTQVVSLFVTVQDAQRCLVPNLEQADFDVFDNEKTQPIVYFDNSVQPITVVVMLDTSGSMTLTIDLLKQAAEQFILRLLPDDKARVGAFNDKIQFNARWTSDRDEL